jgi:hypothetical protein
MKDDNNSPTEADNVQIHDEWNSRLLDRGREEIHALSTDRNTNSKYETKLGPLLYLLPL